MAGWCRDAPVSSSFNRGHHYTHRHRVEYAWAIHTLKSKSGSEMANAIVEIVWESGRYPKNLQTDIGKEFHNTLMCRKSWKNTMLITIPRIRCWKHQWSSGSIARSRTICGRYLRSTVLTSRSTSYRVSCRITMRINIAPAYDPST